MTKMPKKQKGKPTKKKNLPKKSKPPKLDIIERYCNLISGGGEFKGFTDSQRDYQEAIGLFNVSTLIGRKALMFSLPGIKFVKTDGIPAGGAEPMNLWFILIGKSRVARKTVSVSKTFDLLESLSDDILLADDFTPQSLVQILSKKKSGEICAWVNDEISAFFEMLRSNKGYMLTTDAVLSRIYDGRKYSRSTVSRGNEEIENAHLTTMLASTEYLPTLFDEGRFKQGFLNRFIYVVLKPGDLKNKRTKPTLNELEEMNSIIDWFEALFNFTLPGDYPYSVDFTFDAKRLLNKFDRLISKKIRKGVNSREEGWLGNQPDLAERISAVYRIARLSKKELKKGIPTGFIIVEEDDVRKALRYLKKTRGWFKEILILMGQPGEGRAPESIDKGIPYVLDTIKQCGILNNAGHYQCTKSQLLLASHMRAKELDELLNLAKIGGKIKMRTRPRPAGKRGPPTTDIMLLSKRKKKRERRVN